MRIKRLLLCIFILIIGVGNTQADILTFFFSDPAGDHTGMIDLVSFVMTFDNTVGSYQAMLTADSTNHFSGDFRINLNLFNADTGTTNQNPSFFTDHFNDYSLTTPTDTIILTGTNTYLTEWDIGDRVATTHIPLGRPDGVFAFANGVMSMTHHDQGDLIAEDEYTTIVPEPCSIVLLAAGGLGIILRSRRERRR